MRVSSCVAVLLLVSVATVHVHSHADGVRVAAGGRTVFRCKRADVTVFSDVPCDASAEIYVVEAPAAILQPVLPAPEPNVAAVRQAKPVAKEPVAQARTKTTLAERCLRMQQSLQDIRSKMRSGYTSEEGRRLRARQSKLEDQRRSAKC